MMDDFDQVDSFEDLCKGLAEKYAKELHGGPPLTDWTYYASGKDTVHIVICHFISHVLQGGIPAPWVLKFVAEGLARYLKNEVLWPTNARGGERNALPAFVQYINERYPGHQRDIAEHLRVSDRMVRNHLKAKSDRLQFYLNRYRDRLHYQDLAGLLIDLPETEEIDKKARKALQYVENNIGRVYYCAETGELSWDRVEDLKKEAMELYGPQKPVVSGR